MTVENNGVIPPSIFTFGLAITIKPIKTTLIINNMLTLKLIVKKDKHALCLYID